MTPVLDCDQHLFEPADTWLKYCDPHKRDLAMTIEPDELGYWWLTNRFLGRRVTYAWISVPEDGFESMGGARKRHYDGLPSEIDYQRDLPLDYWEPAARIRRLDEWGIDETLLIPNWTLIWERGVGDSLDVCRANMEAWNRWAVELQQQGRGRLHLVGHVTLRGGDLSWLEEQLRLLSKAGVRAATFTYGLVDGRRMSHPDHERAWSMFVEYGVMPVFHVVDGEQRASGLPHEWFENDFDPFVPVVEIPFMNIGIQLSLADLVLNGVLERHPKLRFCCVEFSANTWLPNLKAGIDRAIGQHRLLNGRDLYPLQRKPSEYLDAQVMCAVDPRHGDIAGYIAEHGAENLMFGGDWPHCEGYFKPLENYRKQTGPLPSAASETLYGGTLHSLLHAA
ncbi:MAG: amidohydrolase family protein [Proteobacteria bacterium]|nr:amidohydrolase family protein [Pseudomonadota bacterium]